MPDSKIQDLTAISQVDGNEFLPCVEDPTGTPADAKITVSQIAAFTSTNLANNSVADAKLRTSSGLSIIGRATDTTGNVADISAGSDNAVLRRSGTSLGFGTIGTGSLATDSVTTIKLVDGNVTTAKLADDACTSDKIGLAGIEDVASTTYTFQAADLGKVKRFTADTAVAVTFPDSLSTGFHCLWSQAGAGQITFVGSSLTLRNIDITTGVFKSLGQYALGSVLKIASGEGRITGQLAV